DAADQAIRVVLQVLWLHQRSLQAEALRVAPHPVTFLNRTATAERGPAAAVHELAADVEILLDHQHGGAEIARPHGGMQADTSGAKDDDIGLVAPPNAAVLLRHGTGRQHGCADTGGRAAAEEVTPIEGLVVLTLAVLVTRTLVALPGHIVLPSVCRRLAHGAAELSVARSFATTLHQGVTSAEELLSRRQT